MKRKKVLSLLFIKIFVITVIIVSLAHIVTERLKTKSKCY